MADASRSESSPPAQKCDVCGAAHLSDLFKVRRVRWTGERFENGGIIVCCSPLCLFGAACNPADHWPDPALPPEAE